MNKMFSSIKGKAVRQDRPLTNEELLHYVPSIFEKDKHDSRSDKFAPVATIEVLDQLRTEGYEPFFAVQRNVRDESKRNYTKHMLRLRKPQDIIQREVDEIILVNANDGTASYQLRAGQFRFVCQNGLVQGNIEYDTKVYHKGIDIMGNVIEGVFEVVKGFDEIHRLTDEMKKIELDDNKRLSFAKFGYMCKEQEYIADWNDAKYNPQLLLSTSNLNSEDANSKSLYSTFNTVQQHLMFGGQRGFRISENGDTRRTRSQAVTGIDKNIRLNLDLWKLATAMVGNANTIKDVIDV